MSAPKLFVTGATGYIGGDALHEIITAHPDWNYTCLVRNSDKGAQVAAAYPQIRLVYGDLASADLLQRESQAADIVLHFASADDEPGAKAIAAGLSSKSPSQPGYWIHTSGTGILLFPDIDRNTFGESSSKQYDDIKDVGELTSLPDHAPHRTIDMIVQAAASPQCKTAIMCPPTIYGKGRGPGNRRSIQLPWLARCSLQRGKAFQVGPGKTLWTNIHVKDLSKGYLLLAEAAAAGGGKATWGKDGYYFAENNEHVWGEVSHELAKHGKKLGMLQTDEVDSLPADKVGEMVGAGPMLWGANSRGVASRLRKELAWTPKGPKLVDTMDEALQVEQQLIKDNVPITFHA
ncbi:MAG: hypothetical protein M1828_006042 [Chrysothrix sp. TS-e1954]|nr:MAG: hypothetical protein M1828_006042 [Chrysothrix sp. TS-e1954]